MIQGDRPPTAFLPTPHPGELLYSLAARYHTATAETDIRRTAQQLFGTTHVNLRSPLPGHLSTFFERIGHLVWTTPDEMAGQITLLPMCEFFLPPERSASVRLRMMGHLTGAGGVTMSGLGALQGYRGSLRFCTSCRDDDCLRHGVGIWRRSHQIPGVKVCWRHHHPLQEACPHCGELSVKLTGWTTVPLTCPCGALYRRTIRDVTSVEVRYASFAHELTEARVGFIAPKRRYLAYAQKLRELGLLRAGPAGHTALVNAIVGLMQREALAAAIAPYDMGSSHLVALRAIRGLTRTTRYRVNVDELRLMALLFESAQTFILAIREEVLASVAPSKPTRVSYTTDEFEARTLTLVDQGYKLKNVARQLGVSEYFPKYLLLKLGRPLPPGTKVVDEDKLEQVIGCLRNGETKPAIARAMGIRPGELDGIARAYQISLVDRKQARLVRRLNLARRTLGALIDSGVRSRSELRNLEPHALNALYTFDRSWLDQHAPRRTDRNSTDSSSRRIRSDWSSLDSAVEAKLRDLHVVLTVDPLHPRLSLSRISRSLGFSNTWLYLARLKMPKTSALLDATVESGEQSRARRVRAAVALILNDGEVPTRSKVRHLARVGGVNRYM